MIRTKYHLASAAILVVALFLFGGGLMLSRSGLGLPAAEARAFQAEGLPRTITVVGEGQASGTPDIAQVNIGIQISDPDVQVATQTAAAEMDALLAALKAAGVADEDIRTSYFNVFVDRSFGPQEPGSDVVYQVSNNVQVIIRDLEGLTHILGSAIEAGADNVSGVSVSLSDPSGLKSEARQKAVEDARAKAEELAQLNGLMAGEVINLTEVIDGGVFPRSEFAMAAVGLGGGVGPISPGDVEVSTRLQITYEIVR
jgi:uncharacterized protein YggE